MIRLLRDLPDYRRLYASQAISLVGSMISYVVVPQQVYELTRSNAIVGMLSLAQLVPLVGFALLGGAIADRVDRRRLLIGSEIVMGAATLALAWNAQRSAPSLALIFGASILVQSLNGLHRPALEAATQQLVPAARFGEAASLAMLRGTLGSILGPMLGGWLMTARGPAFCYVLDAATFLGAAALLAPLGALSPPKRAGTERSRLGGEIAFAGRAALRDRVILGSYLIDIVAMLFAFPVALYPALGAALGGRTETGLLYSAMSAGALFTSFLGTRIAKGGRPGRWLVYSAGAWGLAMGAIGLVPGSLAAALGGLAVAGFCDGLSGISRSLIWNARIPNSMRGRFAGIEMISYLTGPLLGNVRAGWMADRWSVSVAFGAGGALCVLGVGAVALALPALFRDRLAGKGADA